MSLGSVRGAPSGRSFSVGTQPLVAARPRGGSPRCHKPSQRLVANALGPGGGKHPQGPLRRLAEQAERHAHQLIDTLTPKHEYDLADVTLIFFSTMVFMWLAACLYRVYAFCFYSSAHHTISTFFGGH